MSEPGRPPDAPASPHGTGPVPAARRVVPLDAARGFALLGIFVVNIGFFAGTLGEAMATSPPADEGPAAVAVWWLTKVLFEGKFYPLFSVLFGMGLMMQVDRARSAGRKARYLAIRRLLVLFLFGVAHVVLLWYGDILVIYSAAGMVLLLCSRLSARPLLVLAGVWLSIAVVLTAGLPLLSAAARADPAEAAPATPPAEPDRPREPDDEPDESDAAHAPVARLIEAVRQGTVTDPRDPVWADAETAAYRHGPFGQSLMMRLFSWSGMVVYMATGLFWHILAMFFVGAALARARFFDADRLSLRRRLASIGLAVGLPLAAAAVVVMMRLGYTPAGKAVGGPLGMIGGGLMAIGYLGALSLLVESGRAGALGRWLASAGRMALTVYLSQSLISCAVMYHWGLGRFGAFTRTERLAFVVAVYVALVIAANLWLRVFRLGPLEWLWRTATYLRAEPLRGRERADPRPAP
jgi:uncharacterized protein